jgi:hypothetical protein
MRNIRTAVAIAALMIAAPAHAELRDVRDYWAMTCYPSRAAPYRVEFMSKVLRITSSSGVRHTLGL